MTRNPPPSSHLFKRFVSWPSEVFDIGAFAESLLLHERVTIDSARLLELPHLIAMFTSDELKTLLEERTLRIYCDTAVISALNKKNFGSPFELPLGSYNLVVPRGDMKLATSGWLRPIVDSANLQGGAKRLKSIIGRSLITAPDRHLTVALRRTRQDVVGRSPLLRLATAHEISARTGEPTDPELIEIDVDLDGDVFVTRSAGLDRFGFDKRTQHEVVQKGLLAVAGINAAIDNMDFHQGVTVFNSEDLPLFAEKVGSILTQQGRSARADQFRRVVELAGLPSLAEAARNGTLRGDKLLEIRETDECKAFRDWLATTDATSDDEIKKMTTGLAARVRRYINSPTGAAIRLVVSTYTGGLLENLVGGTLGKVASAVPDIVDSFGLTHLVKRPGPLSFLDDQYLSVFQDPLD